MYKIIIACDGIPKEVGPTAAIDITEEFTHRPWHNNASCKWDGARLILQAENDFDSNGKALSNEFSDAIAACIAESFDGNITVESINQNK